MLLVLAAFCWPLLSAVNAQPSAIELEEEASKLEAQWTAGSVREAIRLNLASAEAYRRTGDLVHAAQCLRRAARLQIIAGSPDEALLNIKRALALNSKLPPIEAIKSLTLYTRLLSANGKTAEAAAGLKKAEQLSTSTNDPAARGLVFRATGEIHEGRMDFAAAESEYLKAIEIFRQSGNQNRLVRTLFLLAGVRMPLGRAAEGLENIEEAKSICTRTGSVRDVALAQVVRANLLGILGRKQEALDEYLDAEKKFPPDIDLIEKARLLAGLGYAFDELGEPRLSLIKRREAFDLYQHEKLERAVAWMIPLLIDLSFRLGDEAAAFDYLKRSEAIAAGGKYAASLAGSHIFVGDHFLARAENGKAAAYYRKALPIFERMGHSYVKASIHDKLGAALQRAGNNGQARRHLNIALGLSREIPNGMLEANTLFDLARLELSEGSVLDALEFSRASIDRTEQLSASVRNSLLRSSHFASVSERYELFIHLLMQTARQTGDQQYVRQALQAAERSRARSILETISLADAGVTAASPETAEKDRQLRSSLNMALDELANLLNSGARGEAVRKIEENAAQIQHELEELRAGQRNANPAYRAMKDAAAFVIEEFQRKVLRDDSVLFEISTGEKESYLWVIDGQEVSAFTLPPRAELAERVSSLNSALRSREPVPGDSIDGYQQRVLTAEQKIGPEAAALSETLLGPAAARIGGKRLIVVADGPLHYLPFSALPLPGTDGEAPLIETNEIVYQPSAETLLALDGLGSADEKRGSRDLIVFSDPVFASDDSRVTGNDETPAGNDPRVVASLRFVESLESLPRLRGSGLEAESIAGAIGTRSTDLHSGFAATREAFLKADLGRYKMLHLATHALSDSERPERSGVVLSGVAPDGSRLDQFVRLQDIYALGLNADLVVLSACETGIGKELRGEGLLSLNNAFIQAGARSVVSTLWKVDDDASQLFMGHFYSEIAKGRTPSESLRLAQTALRSEPRFRSPFYWAAFTLHGDPNVRPKLSISSLEKAVPLVAVGIPLLGVLGLAVKRRRRFKRSRDQ